MAGTTFLQNKSFHQEKQKDLIASVYKVLEAHKVEQPEVSLIYLDASIKGIIQKKEDREHISKLVNKIPGLRLLKKDNHLKLRGSYTYERVGNQTYIKGLRSIGENVFIPEGFSNSDQSELEKADFVVSPINKDNEKAWQELLGSYFEPQGNRSIKYDGKEGIFQGEAILTLSKRWEEIAQNLSPQISLKTDFEYFPSRYHMKSYEMESDLPKSYSEILIDRLKVSKIYFENNSAEVQEEELLKLDKVVPILKRIEGRAYYVIGGHADATGSAEVG